MGSGRSIKSLLVTLLSAEKPKPSVTPYAMPPRIPAPAHDLVKPVGLGSRIPFWFEYVCASEIKELEPFVQSGSNDM